MTVGGGTATDETAATADPNSFVAYVQTAEIAIRHATVSLANRANTVLQVGLSVRRDFPLPSGKLLRLDGAIVGVLDRTGSVPARIDPTKPVQVAAFLAACARARKWLDGLPAAAEAKWARDRKRHAAAITAVRAAAAEAALAGDDGIRLQPQTETNLFGTKRTVAIGRLVETP